MASTFQNTEFAIPFNDLTKYIPSQLKNEMNVSLLDNLFNRFMTHDESVPFYGYVGQKPKGDDKSPLIPYRTFEARVNAITPVLSFKSGADKHLFTVQDLIRKANTLGVSSDGQGWLYTQGHNFVPPIDIDKFANFFNYFWVAKSYTNKVEHTWNPTLEPEYYVMARPALDDLIKKNVRVATTPEGCGMSRFVPTGTGFLPAKFSVKFISSTQFVITQDSDLGEWIPVNTDPITLTSNNQEVDYQVTNGTETKTLVSFSVIREPIYNYDGQIAGYESFREGDEFIIDVVYLSRRSTITFSGTAGVKGKISLLRVLMDYQTIDGVQVEAGDRVLVKDSTPELNGIYIVSSGEWERAPDFTGERMVKDASVWVLEGDYNTHSLWVTVELSNQQLGWVLDPCVKYSNTYDWQEGNHWYSSAELSALNIPRGKAIQAVRPIIEYTNSVQLNEYLDEDMKPSDKGFYVRQNKTRFNQKPLFDLYRYDGTHSNTVSPLFYYEEDDFEAIDTALQLRPKRSGNGSNDFVFNHGFVDVVSGNTLFAKNRFKNSLVSVWHAGYIQPTLSEVVFHGEGDGELENLRVINFETQQQTWRLSAISEYEFTVEGSKYKVNPNAKVGVPYDNGDIAFTIKSPTTPFQLGESFVFRVGNLERPALVTEGDDGELIQVGSKPTDKESAFTISKSFYNNPYAESRSQLAEGVIYSHFHSIQAAQTEGLPLDYSFGGDIKLWGEQHNLFASLLMQRDMTPLSLVDFAEKAYANSLNNIKDIFSQNVAEFIGEFGGIKDQSVIDKLLDKILSINEKSDIATQALFDSTSPIKGFPATLPLMGCAELVEPAITFVPEMGINVIRHHDGHMSELETTDVNKHIRLLESLSKKKVLRSDGNETPAIGSTSATPPQNPYRGELWSKIDGTLWSFNVDYDSKPPEDAATGSTWWNRSERTLKVKSGGVWLPLSEDRWVSVNYANILNRLILTLENRLYKGINPNARKINFDELESSEEFKQCIKDELYTFSALNNFNPTASNSDPTNAFTWNYSSTPINPFVLIDAGKTPARWFNFLKAHQRMFKGVIPTASPNNEPWKLFGFQTYSQWWASLDAATQQAYTPYKTPENLSSLVDVGIVKVADGLSTLTAEQINFASPDVNGVFAVVDGVPVYAGDLVLVTNHSIPTLNGVWTVAAGQWVRNAFVFDGYYTVQRGETFAGTKWAIITTTHFEQIRNWTTRLWNDVSEKHPNLKLSVNRYTDELLPPYVRDTLAASRDALVNIIPPDINKEYSYGEDGPIESIWKFTSNYLYSRVRALIKHDPLLFLGFAWGFNWVSVSGIMLDAFDVSMPGHKRFVLHGETINSRPRVEMGVAVGSGIPIPLTVTYTAYDSERKQSFTVRNSNGETLGYIQEGTTANIGGWSFTLEDNGIPFRIGDRYEITEGGEAIFVPAPMHNIQGFGQIFTQALRYSSVDTSNSYAIDAFRTWDVNMGYRAEGLVSTDNLTVISGDSTLSDFAYELNIKQNQFVKDTWIQALRISPTRFGTSIIDAATGVHKPSADGSDITFKIEGYNPRFTKLKYYELGMDLKDPITFKALSGAKTDLVWKQPTEKLSNQPKEVNLPLIITGVQNVVNFLFGYAALLHEEGWRFNGGDKTQVDAVTGRSRGFQLEIEKYINDVFTGLTLDQGSIINPFLDRVWVEQPTGILSEFVDSALFDVVANPGVFDMLGVKYKTEDLNIIRRNDMSSFGANGPMFSAHVQIDEYEHLFVFSNFAQPSTNSGMLYDPFSGSYTKTYKFNGRRQQSHKMRPEFGGYYLQGNNVRQNLQASTDNIQRFYDTNHVFENESTTYPALGLLGFSDKKYFNDLDISKSSQFNFWRGMIQYKGTNLSIGAYLNNNRFEDAKIDEFWAYKVAEYGDARVREYPELKVRTSDVSSQFTQYQFDAMDDKGNINLLPGFTHIESMDETRWYSIDDMDKVIRFESDVVGSYRGNNSVGDVIQLNFVADKIVSDNDRMTFEVINAKTIRVTGVDSEATDFNFVVNGYNPLVGKFSPVKLFNYQQRELVREIPVWHPAANLHNPTALESINIISDINPARFNFSTLVTSNYAYDPARIWGKKEVGRVWFDTKKLKYVPYYDPTVYPNLGERLSRWGMVADYGSVDVYEWVQSTVHPSEYNALAISQSGNADIPEAEKADGEVGFSMFYKRDRLWKIHPIAWGFTPVPVEKSDWGNYPPMKAVTGVSLYFEGGKAILESSTFKQMGITDGMHIGGWHNDDINPYPISEYRITSDFSKVIMDESGVELGGVTTDVEGFNANVSLVVGDVVNPDLSGQLAFLPPKVEAVPSVFNESGAGNTYTVTSSIKVIALDNSTIDEVTLLSATGSEDETPLHGATVSVMSGQQWSFSIPNIGLRVIVKANVTGDYPIDCIGKIIHDALNTRVIVRDAVGVEDVVPEEVDMVYRNVSANEPEELVRFPTGWRAWSVPTQNDLDRDGAQPVSSWKPYIGPASNMQGSYDLINRAIDYTKNPLTMNDGTIINRYEYEWSSWVELKDEIKEASMLDNTGVMEFTFDHIVPAMRTSVYINGSLLLQTMYTINGSNVAVRNVPRGSLVTVVVRKYEPTKQELSRPETDLSAQVDYKLDYEYTVVPVRGMDGGITSNLYYFWVKNRSTAAKGKRISIRNITQELLQGPASYLTFQRDIAAESDNKPPVYNAITITGLTSIVTKEDTFKLRFIRDLTLRDDPRELDLKNVHTEWTLIRPDMRTVIPEALWRKLTDSAAGFDIAGNPVPSMRRALYDERNGTKAQFGFGPEQTLAPSELLKTSLLHYIVNTSLVLVGEVIIPDLIEGLDYDHSDEWFVTPESTRKTLTDIWNKGTPKQINEIFFNVLEDILASNYELTDLFKTSRLSAYSIRVVRDS